MRVHFAKALVPGNIDLRVRVVRTHFGGDLVTLGVGIRHTLCLAARELVKRRDGGIDVAVLDQRPHEAEEECEQERADMAAVDVGIGHDDDLVIAQFVEIEFVADAGSQCGDDRLELVVAVDLVGTGLFHVQHLAPEGEDGLEAGISTLRGRAACGIALDDVKLGERGVGVVAVAQLIRHLAGFKARLTADCFAGLPGGFPRPVGHHGLVENELADGWIFL